MSANQALTEQHTIPKKDRSVFFRDGGVGKGDDTRQRIVTTAATVMNRQGWLSTPASAILTATDLKKGGLYNHFDSMNALAGEAFDSATSHLLSVMNTKLSTSAPAHERLLSLLAAFEMVGERRPPFDSGCPILNAATETDDCDEGFRLRVAGVIDCIIRAIAAVIKEGVQTGEFRPDLQAERAARFLFAAFEGGVMLAGVTRDPVLFSQIKHDLVDMVETWRMQTGATS